MGKVFLMLGKSERAIIRGQVMIGYTYNVTYCEEK